MRCAPVCVRCGSVRVRCVCDHASLFVHIRVLDVARVRCWCGCADGRLRAGVRVCACGVLVGGGGGGGGDGGVFVVRTVSVRVCVCVSQQACVCVRVVCGGSCLRLDCPRLCALGCGCVLVGLCEHVCWCVFARARAFGDGGVCVACVRHWLSAGGSVVCLDVYALPWCV